MSDDWRLRIHLQDGAPAAELTERLGEAEHDLEESFHDRVAVSRDDSEVFAYTGTRELAERVEQLVASLAAGHGWEIKTELRHWHPTSEDWEDPDVPLPSADAARAAEHAELIERERAEVAERGYPEFEVRVELPSRRDAGEFADKLREEGLPLVHRWKYVLVGASDEDSAAALAERLRAEAPSGSTVTVEGTWKAMEAETPSMGRHWYAVFGGMGG
jgi:hypothetical protein